MGIPHPSQRAFDRPGHGPAGPAGRGAGRRLRLPGPEPPAGGGQAEARGQPPGREPVLQRRGEPAVHRAHAGQIHGPAARAGGERHTAHRRGPDPVHGPGAGPRRGGRGRQAGARRPPGGLYRAGERRAAQPHPRPGRRDPVPARTRRPTPWPGSGPDTASPPRRCGG